MDALIGKLQIRRLVADAAGQQGEAFRLRDAHVFVWRNGNVPLALQRFELLGTARAVGDRAELDALGGPPEIP